MAEISELPTSFLRLLPSGASIPERLWRRRHRGIVAFLWAHLPVLFVYGLARGFGLLHMLLEVSAIAATAVAASLPRLERNPRMVAATLGLAACSAELVHLSGGLIEMHFHFFVVVAVITLYQSWLPFLLVIAFVALHHGIVGTLDPRAVYNNPSAIAHPWLWAGIHTSFVVAESIACLVAWKANETAALQTAQAIEAERLTSQFLAISRAQKGALHHQALHDALTGLPNRTLLNDRLHQAILTGRRDFKPSSLLLMDMDNFKDVNDTLGHAAGDTLLQQFALRLCATLRDSDTVARLGGDEFAILLAGTQTDGAERAAASILAALREPFSVEDHQIDVSASIGIAAYPDHGDTADALLRRADVAMYKAKRSKSGSIVYNPHLDQHSHSRLTLMTELRRGIENNELRLHYQPLVDLRTQTTTGMEALVRWQHPQHGLLAPKAFVVPAEQTDLMDHLTAWVLAEAMSQVRILEERGVGLSVSVNLPGESLSATSFPAFLSQMMRTQGLAPGRLTLELLEHRVMEEGVEEALRQLRDLGVRLSIDDFGTGFSSLSYLKRLPVVEVKIDQSFVTNLASQPDDSTIVRPIIDLAHNLHLSVVAEGVEDAPTLEMLTSLGCDLAQGNHVAPPMPARELMEWLDASPWPPARTSRQDSPAAV